MKSVTIRRHLRESFKSLKRNGWMSVAAVSAVTVTLLLVGVLLSILLNINKVATDIENDVQVRVIIDRGTNKKQEAALKKKLEKIDGVKKIEFSSKKKELDKFIDNGSIASWAEEGAAMAAYNGIINGVDGEFKPKTNGTRAETAVMLYRLYGLVMD